MSVPDTLRQKLRSQVWCVADKIGWMDLSPGDKTTYYENWTSDPEIGGVLSRYIDKGHVRVYLKDTVLKEYVRLRLSDDARPLRILRIPKTAKIVETFEKPHGKRLSDGRVICWGRADDWKGVLMALHERTHARNGAKPFAAVLMRAIGKYAEPRVRRMIEAAARKLAVRRVVWLEV